MKVFANRSSLVPSAIVKIDKMIKSVEPQVHVSPHFSTITAQFTVEVYQESVEFNFCSICIGGTSSEFLRCCDE